MPRVKIKQLDERVATQGIHLGGGPERRKLEPGEVIEIPDDLLLPDGTSLFDTVWATGKLELTLDPVTRPVDYGNYREGRLCAPGFKPRDATEKLEMLNVRAKIMARVDESESEVPDNPDSLADDVLDVKPKRAKRPKRTAAKAKAPPQNPRAERRARLRAMKLGQEAIT